MKEIDFHARLVLLTEELEEAQFDPEVQDQEWITIALDGIRKLRTKLHQHKLNHITDDNSKEAKLVAKLVEELYGFPKKGDGDV